MLAMVSIPTMKVTQPALLAVSLLQKVHVTIVIKCGIDGMMDSEAYSFGLC